MWKQAILWCLTELSSARVGDWHGLLWSKLCQFQSLAVEIKGIHTYIYIYIFLSIKSTFFSDISLLIFVHLRGRYQFRFLKFPAMYCYFGNFFSFQFFVVPSEM